MDLIKERAGKSIDRDSVSVFFFAPILKFFY